jgi:hypothetical protein
MPKDHWIPAKNLINIKAMKLLGLQHGCDPSGER